MTRREYYEMAVEVLTTEEFVQKFGFTPVDFEDLTWNFNLETAYNEYMGSNDYYADEEVDEGEIQIDLSDDDSDGDFDGYSSNMFCDDSGYCGGSSCPNFFKCHS